MLDISTSTAEDKTRREFMYGAVLAAGAVLLTPSVLWSQESTTDSTSARERSRTMTDKGDPLDQNRVFDFVHKSHFDLDVVKKLHKEAPQLVFASWDWGTGDFETGLGAASHVGRRDIADFLIENGARPNLFCAAMLGNLAVVRGFLEADPALLDCKGPHGLSLIHHAEKGGDAAADVLNYLQSLGQG